MVNIGIGGSDLGPKMVAKAFTNSQSIKPHVYFISNTDASVILDLLERLDPETTMFIISSKSFSTIETITNANLVAIWGKTAFQTKGIEKDFIKYHFCSVTSNIEAALNYGIREEYIFKIWDWVGGRFSVWSSVGLAVSIALGHESFEEFISGANEMDNHFINSDFDHNIPVILALLSLLYRNFFNFSSHAVLPYADALETLPSYLQQLEMESNGKSTNRAGESISYDTSSIIFGGVGTNFQHAIGQLLHQGTTITPCDFIAVINRPETNNLALAELVENHHKILLSNCFAQSKALM